MTTETKPLIDLSGFTEHELFLKSVKGLASQGFERAMRSINGLSKCDYLSDTNTRCAAGWLVDDEAALRSLNNTGSWSWVATSGRATKHHTTFIERLQQCHDNSYTPAVMKEALRSLASVKGWPIPEELL